MYHNAGVHPGGPLTPAHIVVEQVEESYILFSIPQVFVRADFVVFDKILLEAKASEHSSRMVAMKNATDNAKQLIKDLTLEYNKLRQANITRELLEITSAAMAMG